MAKKLFNFFSSIKLAIALIVSAGVMLAIGTFYEAAHGTPLAQKHIYHSWFSSVLMLLFMVNLACAAIDRIPWKKHHIGFVLTHLGIIVMLVGSLITQKRGLDGALYVGLHEDSKFFIINETELRVYQSLEGKPSVLLFSEDVDFDRNPNFKKKLIDDDTLEIKKYFLYAQKNISITPAKEKASEKLPALKFKLSNDQVSVTEWIGLDSKLAPFYDFGPAQVILMQGALIAPPEAKNQIIIYREKSQDPLKYAIFSKKQKKPVAQGLLKVGQNIDTGWMKLQFVVTELVSNADVQIQFIETDRNSPGAVAAIEVKIGNEISWFELDTPHIMKGEKLSYFVSYIRKRYDLGFKLTLQKFKLGTYAGSTMPSSYESTVILDDKTQEPKVISMNEPLKYKGFTLYQTSFEQNERGEPMASIFSVNHDPGRFLKYSGCLCMVFGILTMFYIKPRWTRKKPESA